MKDHFITKFAGGGETQLAPIALLLLLIGIVLILILPRRHTVIPFLIVALLLPYGVDVVFGPFHFYVLRILLVFAWIRVLFGRRSTNEPFRMNAIDKLFLCYSVSAAVIFCILWKQSEAFINQLGFLYTALGIYFFVRFVWEDERDVVRIIKVLALLCLVFSVFMEIEQHTGQNLFSTLGGVPAFTLVRDGRIRAQASFENAISAGIFGAALLPAFVGLWREVSGKLFAFIGVVAASLMAYASNSATPIMVYGAGLLALLFWPFRDQMKWVRRGVVATLIGLQIVMKANVWALIERVSVGGGNGFHRYELVNGFIRHFLDWCLIGVKSTAGWGYFTFDTANQYVFVGANGGLLTLVFFIAILVYCFKALGKSRKVLEANRGEQWLLWGLGSFLFAHLIAFMGLSYFDQTRIQLYVLVAMIASATAPFGQPIPMPEAAQAASGYALGEPFTWSSPHAAAFSGNGKSSVAILRERMLGAVAWRK